MRKSPGVADHKRSVPDLENSLPVSVSFFLVPLLGCGTLVPRRPEPRPQVGLSPTKIYEVRNGRTDLSVPLSLPGFSETHAIYILIHQNKQSQNLFRPPRSMFGTHRGVLSVGLNDQHRQISRTGYCRRPINLSGSAASRNFRRSERGH